jgi:hypothetical protein
VIVSEAGSPVFFKKEIKCQICNRGSPLGGRRFLVAADYRRECGSILCAVEARCPLLCCTQIRASDEPKQKHTGDQQLIAMTKIHAADPQ